MKNTSLIETIYENVAEGIVIVNAEGIILSANTAACELFGYGSEELNNQPVDILINFFNQLHLLAGQMQPIRYCSQFNAVQKNGASFRAQLSISGVVYQGLQVYAAVIHNISEEKRAEQKLQLYTNSLEIMAKERTKFLKNIAQTLEQAKEEVSISLLKEKEVNLLKTRFISLASHEFRSPLSSIQLSAALIERYYDQLDREKVFEHMYKIKRAVGGLTSILEDFLSVERIENGKIEPFYEEFNLKLLCEEIVGKTRKKARGGQSVTYRHIGLKPIIFLDKMLFQHCVSNLLSNAIKYSDDQGRIEILSEIVPGELRIKVSDNGIGIPAADQIHLFKAFFRATNTINIQGTGLGLNIVKRYTALLKGSVSFESNEHEGSTFILSFPDGS